MFEPVMIIPIGIIKNARKPVRRFSDPAFPPSRQIKKVYQIFTRKLSALNILSPALILKVV